MSITRGILRQACALAAAAVALAGTAAQAADLVQEQRPIAHVATIVLSVPGEVRVEQGTRESLVVEADREVLAKLTSEVRDGTLYLRANGSFSTRDPVRLRITVPRLSALRNEGSADVVLNRFTVPRLDLELAGSGTINLGSLTVDRLTAALPGSGSIVVHDGWAGSQRVVMTGAGDYVAPGLVSRSASVAITGAGTATVNVREALSADIGGSGRVTYRGTPTIASRLSGAGTIEPETPAAAPRT